MLAQVYYTYHRMCDTLAKLANPCKILRTLAHQSSICDMTTTLEETSLVYGMTNISLQKRWE